MTVHRLNGKPTASLPKQYRTTVDYDSFRLINKHSVLLVWLDEEEESFEHDSGLTIARTLAKDRVRWGRVVKVHPTSCVPVGSYICPLHMHEPFGCVINGLEHWMTYDGHVEYYTFDYDTTKSLAGDVDKIALLKF